VVASCIIFAGLDENFPLQTTFYNPSYFLELIFHTSTFFVLANQIPSSKKDAVKKKKQTKSKNL
jgi:hypothetical protein